jgi:MFS family permease
MSIGPLVAALGGVLIAGFGWPTIFLVNVPVGVAAMVLVHRFVPADGRATVHARYDAIGTLLLAATLGAYALAMTVGRGTFGPLNGALLLAAAVGLERFVRAESRAASPLVRLTMFRDRTLGAGLAMSALVSTVMMATLVVGPFHLARAFGLDAARVGLVMSVGPLVAALGGVPAGRLVDLFGAHRTTVAGLIGLAAGLFALVALPAGLGVVGYVAPIVVVTAGYALFQAANNTAVMTRIGPDQRGVVSGLLSLSRNIGLLTGAAALGAVFALAGMRVAFAVAALLIVVALTIAARRAPSASLRPQRLRRLDAERAPRRHDAREQADAEHEHGVADERHELPHGERGLERAVLEPGGRHEERHETDDRSARGDAEAHLRERPSERRPDDVAPVAA